MSVAGLAGRQVRMTEEMPFELDQRLQNDTVLICDLALSRVLLMKDSRYPWLILVPRRSGKTEIHQLDTDDRRQLLEESCRVSALMLELFEISKMNVAVLGNIVAQLHMHHIGRCPGDPAWPGPVWGHSPAIPYSGNDLAQRVLALQKALAG